MAAVNERARAKPDDYDFLTSPEEQHRRRMLSVPLTRNKEVLKQNRKKVLLPSLNDAVDTIHETLLDDEAYIRLLEPVYNPEAVNGSLIVDDVMAAQMIKAYASEHGHEVVRRNNLTAIMRAMHTVWRRWNLDRKSRRNSDHGEPGPDFTADANGDVRDNGEE